MIDRSIGWVALVGLLLAGCSTTTLPAPGTLGPTPIDTAPRETIASPPTHAPTDDPNNLPPTTTTGWWGEREDPSVCMPIGAFQVDYAFNFFGNCYGFQEAGPKEVTLDVGQDMDIHMTIPADGAQPIFPLPEPDDADIVQGWLIYDDATMTYEGLLPGTTRLVSHRSCLPTDPVPLVPLASPAGECVVLVVHVREIPTKCVELAEDACRAVGAAATLHAPTAPGQRIVGWVARPDETPIEWPGCGTTFADVTLTFADPAGEWTMSIGRIEPEASGPPRYAWCTY